MADVTMWTDKQVRADFEAMARARLQELDAELAGKEGIVAIEPKSGDYFLAATLGKADASAYAKYPDIWVYFARLDDPEAAMRKTFARIRH
jgi:glutathione S-transferase